MKAIWEQNKDLILIFVPIMVVAIIIVLAVSAYKKKSPEYREAKKTKVLNTFFRILCTIPIMRGYTMRCLNKLKALSVQDRVTLRKDAAVTAIKGVACMLAIGVGGMFIVSGLVNRALLFVLGFMVARNVLDKRIQYINLRVLMSMGSYIGLVREEFLRRGNIPDALEYTECPSALKICIENIKEVMGAADAEEKLNQFLEKTSNDFLKTFAIACVKINDMGEDSENNNDPTFIKVLKYLEEDVNAEIERRNYSRNLFGNMAVGCLFPVVTVDIVPKILSGSMPGLNIIYGGIAGYIIKTAIIVASIYGFYRFNVLSNPDGIEMDDRIGFIEELLKNHKIAYIAEAAAPKKQRLKKEEKLLRKSLSRKSVRSLTLERIVLALGAFVLTIIIGIAAGNVQKRYAMNSTNSFGLVAADDTADWGADYVRESDEVIIGRMLELTGGKRTMKAADLIEKGLIKDDELHSYIEGKFAGLTELQIEDQMDRIKKKFDLMQSGYFKWWFIPLAYVVAIVAYIVPTFLLKFRLWNIGTREQEEFLSLQTLCTIIAISDADVLDALESMYKMARLYKEPLKMAYLNYTMDPAKELERLSTKVALSDFKRLVKKLQLAVEDISLKEAFEGMEIERKHIVTMREQQSRVTVAKRVSKAKKASNIAKYIMIGGLLLLPLLYVGATEMLKAFDALGKMGN